MTCPDCGMTPADPEKHKEFHDRVRALQARRKGHLTVVRPVSSDERREQEDGA